MLVRAKRLEWELIKSRLNGAVWRAKAAFGDYRISEYDGNLFQCKFRGVYLTTASTYELAQSACQSDFDRRWRESTEVPDLVWTGDGYARSAGTDYHVEEISDGTFRLRIGQFIQDEVFPSKEAIVAACNAHNRAAVLGE